VNTHTIKVTIQDSTLRDGNHAIQHKLSVKNIEEYCIAANKAGIPIVEVGHGNGLGGSSLQVGFSSTSDTKMLKVARENLHDSKLAVFIIPGFGTIKSNLEQAVNMGVDVVRVGCHCTEADITKRHIEYTVKNGIEVIGSLMMSHSVSKEFLLQEAEKIQDYGAHGVCLYDSAGAYLPNDTAEKISYLTQNLNIKVGFHAHNNLGMAVANSVIAVQSGASIIDGSIVGFGAGSGNAQLEVLVAVFEKMGIRTGVNLYGALDCADLAVSTFVNEIPSINVTGVVSGLAGVFSGFNKHVERIAKQYNIDARDLLFELGKRNVVAGQEDLIIEVAANLRRSC
jgi:4-hydroxy 2-oxovalerate aldolase